MPRSAQRTSSLQAKVGSADLNALVALGMKPDQAFFFKQEHRVWSDQQITCHLKQSSIYFCSNWDILQGAASGLQHIIYCSRICTLSRHDSTVRYCSLASSQLLGSGEFAWIWPVHCPML